MASSVCSPARKPCVTIRQPLRVCSSTCNSGRTLCNATREVFVSPEWLMRQHSDDVSVCDVRGTVNTTPTASPGAKVEVSSYISLKDSYLERHITDAIDVRRGIPVQLDLNADNFAAVAEEKGISTDRPVILYDDGFSGSMFACRVWWSLMVHGHPNAHVLKGGWRAWNAAGGPTEIDEPCPLKIMSNFEATMRWDLYSDIHDVVSASQDPGTGVQILDVRSTEQYQGIVRRSKHAGRVPGAKSLPYKRLLGPEETLLDEDQLKFLFGEAGIDLDSKTIVYCNGGVSACVVAAALESVGTTESPTQWSVYDGSWNEYGNQDTFPFEGG